MLQPGYQLHDQYFLPRFFSSLIFMLFIARSNMLLLIDRASPSRISASRFLRPFASLFSRNSCAYSISGRPPFSFDGSAVPSEMSAARQLPRLRGFVNPGSDRAGIFSNEVPVQTRLALPKNFSHLQQLSAYKKTKPFVWRLCRHQ